MSVKAGVVALRKECSRTTEEITAAGYRIPASECAPPRRRGAVASRPPRACGRGRRAAELGEITIRLLEVVAQDLLVLGRAFAVDRVTPLYEPLVEGRARAFQDSVVCRVADEDVVEA